MIEIEGDCLELRDKPSAGALKKLGKAGTLRELTIFSSATLGPAWAKHADVFRELGLETLNFHRFGKDKDDFAWLGAFAFVEELGVQSDLIPDATTFEHLTNLKGLAIGLERRGPVKDASEIAEVAGKLEWLTLTGRWKNCHVLTILGSLAELALSYYEGDSAEFLKGLSVRKLTLHESRGLDLDFLTTLADLEALNLLPLPKDKLLPDLRALPKLAAVEMMKSARQPFDASLHFGEDVEVEVY